MKTLIKIEATFSDGSTEILYKSERTPDHYVCVLYPSKADGKPPLAVITAIVAKGSAAHARAEKETRKFFGGENAIVECRTQEKMQELVDKGWIVKAAGKLPKL
jgi:hypothetical protein